MISEAQARQHLVQYFTALGRFPAGAIQPLVQEFRYKALEAGSFLVQAGQPTTQVAYIAEGILRLYYLDREGRERTKSFCLENHWVGAYSALLLKEPAHFFIRAEAESALLTIPFQTLLTHSAQDASWQALHLALLQELYIRKERRESELLQDDATTRYLKFLEQYPGLEGRVKQHQIASFLGITPVSLSRIRAKLKPLT